MAVVRSRGATKLVPPQDSDAPAGAAAQAHGGRLGIHHSRLLGSRPVRVGRGQDHPVVGVGVVVGDRVDVDLSDVIGCAGEMLVSRVDHPHVPVERAGGQRPVLLVHGRARKAERLAAAVGGGARDRDDRRGVARRDDGGGRGALTSAVCHRQASRVEPGLRVGVRRRHRRAGGAAVAEVPAIAERHVAVGIPRAGGAERDGERRRARGRIGLRWTGRGWRFRPWTRSA